MRRRPTISALFDDYGTSPTRFEEGERPTPANGEVVIQVVAAGVSHMDAFVREGRFRTDLPISLPSRQGVGFAGIVRGVGAGVARSFIDTEVLGHDPGHGALATFITVDAGAIVPKPARVPWEVAAALYLVGLTAYTTVQDLRLGSDDVVVVSAPSGGVGHIECQLARLAGATVIGIGGRESHDYLRSIGVRPVTYGDALEHELHEAAGGRDITALLDNFGTYESLAAGLGIQPDRVRRTDHRRRRELDYWQAGPESRIRTDLADLAELVSEWNLRVLVSGFYPFTQLDTAFADLAERHSRGVVVVGMDAAAAPREYLRQKLRTRYEDRPVTPAA